MKHTTETALFLHFPLRIIETQVTQDNKELNKPPLINLYPQADSKPYNRMKIDFSLSNSNVNWKEDWFSNYE